MRRSGPALLALVLAAAAIGSTAALAGSKRGRPEVVSLAGGLEPLKLAFAAADGRPRYVAVVSPT